MANSGNAGGPPGTTIAGPISCTTKLSDTHVAAVFEGPVECTTNPSQASSGAAFLRGPVCTSSTKNSATRGPFRAVGPLYLATNTSETAGHVAGLTPVCFTTVMATNIGFKTGILAVPGTNGLVNTVRMPFGGSVVGMSATVNAAIGASGSVTVRGVIGGTIKTGSLSKVIAATKSSTYSQVEDMTSFTFDAGDTLTIHYKSTTTAITATDLSAILWTL